MAVLSYIIFFIPLVTGAHKTSPFVKFHANQGTVLFLLNVAWGIAYGVLLAIFTAIFLASLSLGGLATLGVITTILGLVWFVPAILAILGIINAATGKIKPLPIIGKITLIK